MHLLDHYELYLIVKGLKNSMKILIISDVHKNIKQMDIILSKNKDYDLKIFLGDFELFSREKHKEQLNKFDFSVTGNCDIPNLSKTYEFITLNNNKILITHGHMFSSFLKKIDFKKLNDFARKNSANIILHGHDHIATNITQNKITRFNPGSISFPRNGNKPSYGTLTINNDGSFNFKHHYI